MNVISDPYYGFESFSELQSAKVELLKKIECLEEYGIKFITKLSRYDLNSTYTLLKSDYDISIVRHLKTKEEERISNWELLLNMHNIDNASNINESNFLNNMILYHQKNLNILCDQLKMLEEINTALNANEPSYIDDSDNIIENSTDVVGNIILNISI